MTSREQVREEIARVLFDAIDLNRAVLADCELIADAILARWPVLAGVTEEMVEAGARALNAEGWTCYQGADEPGNYDDCEDCRRVCAGPARAVLVAAREALAVIDGESGQRVGS